MNWGKVAEVAVKIIIAAGPVILSLLSKDDGVKTEILLKK